MTPKDKMAIVKDVVDSLEPYLKGMKNEFDRERNKLQQNMNRLDKEYRTFGVNNPNRALVEAKKHMSLALSLISSALGEKP